MGTAQPISRSTVIVSHSKKQDVVLRMTVNNAEGKPKNDYFLKTLVDAVA